MMEVVSYVLFMTTSNWQLTGISFIWLHLYTLFLYQQKVKGILNG